MTRYTLLVFYLFYLVLLGVAFAQTTYTVAPGDTLFGIAGRFDTNVETLQRINGLTGTTIRIGQPLRLPSGEMPLPEGYRRHTVGAGETLAAIASRYGVRESVLRAVNPKYAAGIPAGAVLRVPPAGGELIPVREPSKLLNLALERGLSPADVLWANGLSDIDELQPGQLIFVPPKGTAEAVATAAHGAPAAGPGLVERRDDLIARGRRALADAGELLLRYEPQLQGYGWPLQVNGRISSRFGRRNVSVGGNTYHGGLDIAAPFGTRILAARDGRVVRSGWVGAYGYVVYIDHADGSQTRYAHMSRILTRTGRAVSRGNVIGLVGSTGASTGPHLHFEIRLAGYAIDPLSLLSGR